MDVEGKYNIKSTGVKRLMRESSELKDRTDEYYAYPLEDNLFEWHFTVRGPPDSDFEGGLYHGRILLPIEYPMQPPNIILVTPNGRFETNKKICLSISGHHPETWQPSWSIRTALLAIIAFMPTPGNGTIGSLDYTKAERQRLARKSHSWECPECGKLSDLLPPINSPKAPQASSVTKYEKTSSNEEIPESSNGKIAQENPQNASLLVDTPAEVIANIPTKARVPSPCINSLNNNFQSATSSTHLSSFLNVAMAVCILIIAFLIYRRLFLV